jgi:hypothetical protein
VPLLAQQGLIPWGPLNFHWGDTDHLLHCYRGIKYLYVTIAWIIRQKYQQEDIWRRKKTCTYKEISFQAVNQINKQLNNEELSDSAEKETRESVYKDKDPNHMFNSFLYTFLNICQARFPVKYKSRKKKMTGLHEE